MTEEQAHRVVLTGVVPVQMPPEQAIQLFTAEGERSWVPGWCPTYPDPATSDDTEVGVVWQTQREEGTVTWVVADRQPTQRRYVFVLPGVVAGCVTVECVSHTGGSLGNVVYDVTALDAEGLTYIQTLTDGFEAEMGNWTTNIERALSSTASASDGDVAG